MTWRRLILVLLLPIAAVAQEPTAQPSATLSVKPLLCIVDKRTPACDMNFAIAWQSTETGYYCVFSDLEASALRCWSEQRSGNLDDQRTVVEAFTYWLNAGEGRPALATAKVEVLQKDGNDRRRRRRTRHVWDLL